MIRWIFRNCKETFPIRAYAVGPYGHKHYGFIEERWGDQVKFRLASEQQGYWMHHTHAVVVKP